MNEKKVVLAIGAHPDDIELGCSGTLLRHVNNKDKIYLLILTKGEASGDPDIRTEECYKSAEILCAEKIFFGELSDTKIEDGIHTINTIENIINKIKPDIIYSHSYKDTHQDHRNTSYATLSAGRRVKKILMYESPTSFIEFSPHVYIDIKKSFEEKKRIIRIFSSQSDKVWWPTGKKASAAIEGLGFYRGYQVGMEVAEAFEVARFAINSNEKIFH